MKLSYATLENKDFWESKGVGLPSYDVRELARKTVESPRWVHMGIGNIFRIFIGGIADKLISEKLLDRGITCVETFDYDVVDKIYKPFDNLVLAATLHQDGKRDFNILGSLCEALKAETKDPAAMKRLEQIFTNKELQLVSFTITEKGYALKGADGNYLSYVKSDIENGPEKSIGAMAIVTSMLYKRFKAGATPLALVSMDNVSQNGKKLRESVLEMAEKWVEKGFVEKDFLSYVGEEKKVSFPWSMIDKITPRPGEALSKDLKNMDIEDMDVLVTSKKTYIAPFVNAEGPQYLVIEDSFPNGRPPFEKAGVFMTDRETVNKSERMKVTVCLNPIHTALCTYDCLLGYTFFADGMKDPELSKLAKQLGYVEGLPVVEDPKILSPKAFLDEVLNVRFPNAFMGDTSARIAVDISQMVGIRFGHTIKEHIKTDGTDKLVALPLAIAGWIRYLLAVDDNGKKFELSPDPMLNELTKALSEVKFGDPESVKDNLRPILSNENIFGLDLYSTNLGEKIENMVKELISGQGAVRKTLKQYLS